MDKLVDFLASFDGAGKGAIAVTIYLGILAFALTYLPTL